MKKIFVKTGNLHWVILCALFAVTGCQKNIETPTTNSSDATSQTNAANERRMKGTFQQVNIVSDVAGFNPIRIDPNLINAWGLAFDTSGLAVVVSNGLGIGNIYKVTAPSYVIPPIIRDAFNGSPFFSSKPTGIVLHGSALDGRTAPSPDPFLDFTVVGEDGVISGFFEGGFSLKEADPADGYTGVTIADEYGFRFLYNANFKAKRIDGGVRNFNPFNDPSIPPDYAPFNIQNINNNLFVMYAKIVPGTTNVQNGPGLGYVDIFKPDGTLLKSFAKGGVLNAPWGCVMAPASWPNLPWDGDSSANNNGTKKHFNNVKSVILVGNSGDGRINAFSQDGEFLGNIRSGKEAITIDGLKGLSFAPASIKTINPNWLFFTAGPDHGTHGLFGYLQAP
jgi:uncharacterized protein (TIGR03118 family)